MSDQFSELKQILTASSNLSFTSEQTIRDARVDGFSTSSDGSSSDSDFPLPVSTVTTANVSVLNPGVLQLIVQDISHAETTGKFSPSSVVSALYEGLSKFKTLRRK